LTFIDDECHHNLMMTISIKTLEAYPDHRRWPRQHFSGRRPPSGTAGPSMRCSKAAPVIGKIVIEPDTAA